MSLRPHERKQVAALVAMLKALPERVVTVALTDFGATPPTIPAAAKPRLCKTCEKPYPVCRSLWADDHEFESPTP